MPRETKPAKAARVKQIIAGLQKAYPDAHCALNFSNPLELLIATILSAQCTDARVNMVTPQLFKKYPKADDYAKAPIAELETLIRSTGFYKNKARALKNACALLVKEHAGKVPADFEALVALPG